MRVTTIKRLGIILALLIVFTTFLYVLTEILYYRGLLSEETFARAHFISFLSIIASLSMSFIIVMIAFVLRYKGEIQFD
jgi:hypothetical protein